MRVSLPNGFEPREYQRRYMRYFDNGGKRAMCVWHRRAGKDLTALHQVGKMAHERRGVYWHTLPTYRQAKKAIWDGFTSDGKKIIDSVFPPAIVKRKNESEMLVELKCGSLVQLVGSDTIDRLVGSGPVHVTFSEFALCRPSSWDLTRPMLRENNGSASFITTPRGKNHGFKLYEMAAKNPDWFCEKLSIFESGAYANPQSVIDEERAEGMEEALIRQEYLCDWTAALVGSVWGDLLEKVEKAGGFEAFEHERDGVFTVWDLGFTDSTGIWFFRITDAGVDVVDHYEAHGQPLSHYFDELERRAEQRDYQYVKHWLPHDARAKSLQTGASIIEQFIARFGVSAVEIATELSLLDGIQAARWLLQRGVRFHPRCGEGLEALKAYRYEYDEDKKTFTRKPVHDWSSHSADAFRYLACVARNSGLLRPEKPKARAAIVIPPAAPTMDELWAETEGDEPRTERI
jgi:phage terminase large subunit